MYTAYSAHDVTIDKKQSVWKNETSSSVIYSNDTIVSGRVTIEWHAIVTARFADPMNGLEKYTEIVFLLFRKNFLITPCLGTILPQRYNTGTRVKTLRLWTVYHVKVNLKHTNPVARSEPAIRSVSYWLCPGY